MATRVATAANARSARVARMAIEFSGSVSVSGDKKETAAGGGGVFALLHGQRVAELVPVVCGARRHLGRWTCQFSDSDSSFRDSEIPCFRDSREIPGNVRVLLYLACAVQQKIARPPTMTRPYCGTASYWKALLYRGAPQEEACGERIRVQVVDSFDCTGGWWRSSALLGPPPLSPYQRMAPIAAESHQERAAESTQDRARARGKDRSGDTDSSSFQNRAKKYSMHSSRT